MVLRIWLLVLVIGAVACADRPTAEIVESAQVTLCDDAGLTEVAPVLVAPPAPSRVDPTPHLDTPPRTPPRAQIFRPPRRDA